MQLLDGLTIFSTLLMVGVELAVSLFINPMATELAGSLGRVMPFWYGSCLLLLAAEAFVRRHEAGETELMCAAVLWLFTIIYTIAVLVPINNRIAASTHTTPSFDWKRQHKRWDTLHRWRIGLLVIAGLAFMSGLHHHS